MATKSKHKGGLKKKYLKQAGGNFKKAWQLQKAAKGGSKKPASKKPAKKSGHKPANLRYLGAAHHAGSKSGSHRKSGKRGHTKHHAPHSRTVKTTVIRTGRHTTQLAVVPVPSAARHTTKRKSGGKSGKGGSKRSRAKEHYMMENPLGGAELVVGGITALLGFVIDDGVDRVLATHALTDSGNKDSAGNEMYTDTPPTSGNYSGLFNATAIMAPMNATRWIVGGLITVVPIGLAQVVKSSVGRSALQCFGFGAGVRWLGKALVDLVSMVSVKTGYGQRLYDGEMRAASLAAGSAGYPLASLPSTGLGRVGTGSCCGNCSAGLPCCRSPMQPTQPQVPPGPPPPPPPTTVTPPQSFIPVRQPVPPQPQPAPPPTMMNSGVTGVPRLYHPRHGILRAG